MTEKKEADNQPINHLSPEMQQLLEEESIEAEIRAAIDAAAEEGIYISRQEAIETLNQKIKIPPTPQ